MAHRDAGGPRLPRWVSVAGVIGELLLTGGLVVLLFVVYELFVTDLVNRASRATQPSAAPAVGRTAHDDGTPIAPSRTPAATPSQSCTSRDWGPTTSGSCWRAPPRRS